MSRTTKKKSLLRMVNKELLAKFERYNKRNPKVYQMFVMYSKKLKRSGRKRYSAWAIVNQVRWEHDIKTYGDKFKISNEYIGLFARKLIDEDASFLGFFRIKKMKAVV